MQLPLINGRLGSATAVPVSEDPLVSVLQAGFMVLFADKSQVAVVDMRQGRVRGRASSQTGAFDFVRSGLKFDVAVGLGGVRRLSLADVDAPKWGAVVDLGDDIRSVSATNSLLRYARAGEGITPVVSSIPGVLWALPSWDFHHRIARVSGSWALTTDGAITHVDTYAGKEVVRIGVGVLAAFLAMGLLGVLIRRRPANLLRRVMWGILGFAGVVWLLVDVGGLPLEMLHIVEYAALGALLHRALATAGGGAATAVLAVLLGTCVAYLDEGVQWLLPMRAGQVEDVWLDARAALAGVFVAAGAWAPAGGGTRRGWTVPLGVAAALVVWTAAFQHLTVGFGMLHSPEPGLEFTSRLDLDELRTMDSTEGDAFGPLIEHAMVMERREFFQIYPARKHPFLYEFLVHVGRRDSYYGKRELDVACGEQRILTAFWGRTEARSPFAWTYSQRELCIGNTTPYSSPVSNEIITSVPLWLFWTLSLSLAGVLIAMEWLVASRSAAGRTPARDGTKVSRAQPSPQ
jgi:VanZ family protein